MVVKKLETLNLLVGNLGFRVSGLLLRAPTGRKRAKNAFSPKPFRTGLRGTNSTLGPVEGSKMLLPPRMA